MTVFRDRVHNARIATTWAAATSDAFHHDVANTLDATPQPA